MFVDPEEYTHKDTEIRFDMFDGEFTHEGDLCTLEVLLTKSGHNDPALQAVAEVVHDIDLKDGKYRRPEAAGIAPLIEGIALRHADDMRRLEEGVALFESLYARFRSVHPLKVGGSKRPKGRLDSKSGLSSPPDQHKAEVDLKLPGKSKIKRRPSRSKR